MQPPKPDEPAPSRAPSPRLLSVEDVARALNISVTAVRQLVKLRHLPAPKKVGTKLSRWFPEDIDLFLYRLRRGDLD